MHVSLFIHAYLRSQRLHQVNALPGAGAALPVQWGARLRGGLAEDGGALFVVEVGVSGLEENRCGLGHDHGGIRVVDGGQAVIGERGIAFGGVLSRGVAGAGSVLLRHKGGDVLAGAPLTSRGECTPMTTR